MNQESLVQSKASDDSAETVGIKGPRGEDSMVRLKNPRGSTERLENILNDPTNVRETIQKLLYINCRWEPAGLHGETQELHDPLHNAQTNANMIQQISKK